MLPLHLLLRLAAQFMVAAMGVFRRSKTSVFPSPLVDVNRWVGLAARRRNRSTRHRGGDKSPSSAKHFDPRD